MIQIVEIIFTDGGLDCIDDVVDVRVTEDEIIVVTGEAAYEYNVWDVESWTISEAEE